MSNQAKNTTGAGGQVHPIVMRLSELDDLFRKVTEFNTIPLAQLVLIADDGQQIPFPPDMLKEWEFVGLSNKFFIEQRYWENRIA